MSDRLDQLEARATDMVIRVTLLGLFVYWSLSLVRPFLPIVIWAVVLAVALYPLHTWLVARLGGRRGLAAALITLAGLLVVLGPVAVLAKSFVETVIAISTGVAAGTLQIPPPPVAIGRIPMVGGRVDAFWALASSNVEQVFVRYHDVLAPMGEALLGFLSAVSFDLAKFILSVILMAPLLVSGKRLAAGGKLIAARIVAPRGAHFVDLAGVTIRNVVRGVVGVAFLQAMLIGIVLYAAGVTGAGLLAFAVLILCIMQVGPGLVVLPVLIWGWATLGTAEALVMTVLLVPLTFMDNVLKPLLMGRGLSTPTLVIFLGVIGGTLTYGMIGLFLGPVVLAVFYDLVLSWTLIPPSSPKEEETV